ncbi:HalOD1 output domain-containing protein [Halorientalis sp. IM1011]|uniref:HalOD1 output domain-containing protein n=1 Tax=Halorientalis sp. IM1011 TaxID=1932360 RepID=UPI0009FF6691|nr:HalOD1 output domain-containing protein [Halorientalis sp. IM1011]
MADKSISYALVREVAAEKGVDPEALVPLHDVIDPDALESMFDNTDGSTLRNGHLSFSYEGFSVRVDDDGSVSLTSAPYDE